MTKKIKMLDINSFNFVEEFMKATGLEPGDTVEIKSSQFKRPDGKNIEVPEIIGTKSFWETINQWSGEDLKSIGMSLWDTNGKEDLYLIPYEWYNKIPDGTILTSISSKISYIVFKQGSTSDDHRFGYLSYGILIPKRRNLNHE